MQYNINPEFLLKARIHDAVHGYLMGATLFFFGSLFLYFALSQYDYINKLYLNLWLLLQITISIGLLTLYFCYHKNIHKIEKIWARWIEIPLSIMSGSAWGLTWFLFVDPEELEAVIFISGSTSLLLLTYAILSPLYRIACNLRIISCVLPIIIKSYSIANDFFDLFIVATILFAIITYLFSLRNSKLYLKMLWQQEENKRLLSSLQDEKKQVEEASLEKTRFFAAANHDLRQPIQAINLFEAALASQLTQAKQKEILQKISLSNKNLSDLLEPLLDISKLDSGAMTETPEVIHLDDLFYHIEKQYVGLAAENRIDLRCVFTSQKLYADPVLLGRILSNLIGNAIKHMNRSGKIVMGVRHHQDGISIEVWDNGQGIPQREQEKIFLEFYQVNNPERNRNQGTGLGLAIVKRLANMMKCQLRVRSIEHKGCCFSVFFPLSGQSVAQSPTKQPEVIALPSFNQAYNILIIEDDHVVADALVTLLSSWGMRTTHANNTATAIESLQLFSPDLILSDYQLAQGQIGFDIIAAIQKEINRKVPVLMLTGSSNAKQIQQRNTQSFPVLYKPIDALKLQKNLVDLLQP
ncbi:MAG: hybrid sensor histidine kinase/response regulator [Mariprofundaceae bacterium]|nr:hybrid sensor histidine kinase/response regulator [Mariprofundaceae bacterium]